MIDNNKKELFSKTVSNYSTIHIFMHDQPAPDPDSIGSAVGLSKLLKDVFQKKVIIHGIPTDHRMNTKMVSELDITLLDPRDKESMSTLVDNDDHGFMLVDCTLKSGSFHFTEHLGDKKPLWILDHHPNKEESETATLDLQAVGSCATIVTEYLRAFDVAFDSENKNDRNVATALMLGLMVDTDNLRSEDVDVKRDVDTFIYLRSHYNLDLFNSIMKYDIPRYFNDALQATNREKNQQVTEPYAILTPGFLKEERLGVLSFIADYWIRVERINIVVAFAISGNEIIASIRTKTGTKASDLVKPLFPTGRGGGKKFASRAMCTVNGMFDVGLLDEAGKEALLVLTMTTLVARMKIFLDADE
jgi:nanoRNase/pAp phosphatase (c-di-AMP/oligoRNAs hydrolase)